MAKEQHIDTLTVSANNKLTCSHVSRLHAGKRRLLTGFLGGTVGSEKVLSLLSLPQVEVSCLVTSTERTKLRVTAPHTLASPGRERRERGRARWEDWNVVKEMPVADWLNPQMTTPTKGKPTTSYPAGGRSQQLFRYDSYPVLCFLCFLHIIFSLYIVYTGISSYLQMLCTFFPPFFESYFPLKRKVEKKNTKKMICILKLLSL